MSIVREQQVTMSVDASPRVSVLIPSFNHARYIADAIRSVREQTYPDWEVVVVDDCSADDSVAVVEAIGDPRVVLLRNERNLGINPTLARALAASTGSLVSVLASDDMLLPDKLERQVALMRRSGAEVVYGGGIQLLEDGSRAAVDLSAFARDVVAGRALHRAYTDDTSLPLLQSALFERSAFAALSVHRERVRLDDWITLIKALEEFRVAFLDEPVFVYRQHAANTFRRYEHTLGLRLEIIAAAVPPSHRREALGRLLASQANYLAWDRRVGEAVRYFVASQGLRPSLGGMTIFARALAFGVRQRQRDGRRA